MLGLSKSHSLNHHLESYWYKITFYIFSLSNIFSISRVQYKESFSSLFLASEKIRIEDDYKYFPIFFLYLVCCWRVVFFLPKLLFLACKSISIRLSIFLLNARNRDFGEKLSSNNFLKWSSKHIYLLFWIFVSQKYNTRMTP
jgi:hypothetical protein